MDSGSETIVLGTRGSRLARTQTQMVAQSLEAMGFRVETRIISTTGDEITDRPLAEIGGKGLFVSALEEALAQGQVDAAVHSLKDVPGDLPDGFTLAAFLPREDPRDALVSFTYRAVSDLPTGAKVGTGSKRRAMQFGRLRGDIEVVPTRGNVESRLNKARSGELDGVILAMAGLVRLGLAELAVEALEEDIFVPAPCQGIVAVEIRNGDSRLGEILRRLDDASARTEGTAERAAAKALGADCHTPIGVRARIDGDGLTIRIALGDEKSGSVITVVHTGERLDPEQAGAQAAELIGMAGERH